MLACVLPLSLLASACVSAHGVLSIADGEGCVPARFQEVDALLKEAVADGDSAGLALLVVRRGDVEFLQVHGEAELGTGRPLRTDSIFRVYSMTKAMTSVAAMMLWEEGKIRLDDPVSDYLPEWGQPVVGKYTLTGHKVVPAERAMTIRDLLRHTSGIPYYGWLLPPYPDLYEAEMNADGGPKSLADFSRRLSKVPLVHQPQAMWTYGAGTDVLGLVVEVVSGQPFEEFLEERLITPLGMVDTGFFVEEEGWSRFAALHEVDEEGKVSGVDESGWAAYRGPPSYPSGGGGLVSTLSDYLIFLQMLLEGGEWKGRRYLNERTVELMTSPSSAAGAPHPVFNSFGLGFEVIAERNEHKGWAMEGAYGWSGIARTHYMVDPERGLILLLFQQVLPFDVGLRNEVFEAVHKALSIFPRRTTEGVDALGEVAGEG
jgi:CubicO group peptidase (beta-lactamase class C family)